MSEVLGAIVLLVIGAVIGVVINLLFAIPVAFVLGLLAPYMGIPLLAALGFGNWYAITFGFFFLSSMAFSGSSLKD